MQGRKERSREGIRKKNRKDENKETWVNSVSKKKSRGKQGRKERSRKGFRKKNRKDYNKETRGKLFQYEESSGHCKEGKKGVEKELERKRGKRRKRRIRRQGETLAVRRKQGKMQGRKERSRKGIRKKRRKMRIRRQGETL